SGPAIVAGPPTDPAQRSVKPVLSRVRRARRGAWPIVVSTETPWPPSHRRPRHHRPAARRTYSQARWSMPLVFVHGVSVRAGPSYERQTRFRNAAFRRHVLDDPDTEIVNPYWGDIGAKAAWGHASLPGEPVLVLDALGPQA